jgi:uncharacterized DUF497 family protein
VAFDWDEANEEHIALHGVTPEEAEEALTDTHRVGAPAYNTPNERRQAALGATLDGRVLYVVYTLRRAPCGSSPRVTSSQRSAGATGGSGT